MTPSENTPKSGSLGSIVLAGGGTAGHVSPLLAIADAVKEKHPDTRITVVGTSDGLEQTLVPEAGYPLATIAKVPLPRRLNSDLLKVPFRLKKAVDDSATILQNANADVVVGVGGYVCTPVYLAAKRLNIPVIVHEANKKAGLANKVGARSAAIVATAYPETTLGTASRHVGMPMRKAIADAQWGRGKAQARTELGLDPNRLTLVVSGGSSGAVSINEAMAGGAQALLDAGVQIYHLTGIDKRLSEAEHLVVNSPHYHQHEYLKDMHKAYVAADLLVTRAGAGTVFELTAVGAPSIFVPLPIGNGEQERNVAHLKESGSATVVANRDFTADFVAQNIGAMIQDENELKRQAAAMAAHGIRDAATQMVELIEEVIR